MQEELRGLANIEIYRFGKATHQAGGGSPVPFTG